MASLIRSSILATALSLVALSGSAAAIGAPIAAPIARPNPALLGVHLDYVTPLQTPSGATASLPPLARAVIAQAVLDNVDLANQTQTTLGGFAVPGAPGSVKLTGTGHSIVGLTQRSAQIPHYAQAAGGKVNVFAYTGASPASGKSSSSSSTPGSSSSSGSGITPPPEQGLQPVPGLGVPPAVVPPTNSNTVPPPNQGFGGAGSTGGQSTTTTSAGTTTTVPAGATTTTTAGTTTSPAGTGSTTTVTTSTVPGTKPATTTTTPSTTTTTPTTTTTTTKPVTTTTTTTTTTKPVTTTTTPSTTTTTPTTTTPATTTTTPSPPPTVTGNGGSCGVAGLTINSDHATCHIHVENMAPGGSASEVMTITNDSSEPFTLSLQASGSQNQLWNDLEMGVWEQGTGAPSPLPALLLWTTQSNTLVTLASGASISYEIELYLPTSAGNDDQGLVASIALTWTAQG